MSIESTSVWMDAGMSGFAPNWLKFTLLFSLLAVIVSMRIFIDMAWRIMRRSRREAHYAGLLASLITMYVGGMYVSYYFPKINVANLVKQAADLWTMIT